MAEITRIYSKRLKKRIWVTREFIYYGDYQDPYMLYWFKCDLCDRTLPQIKWWEKILFVFITKTRDLPKIKHIRVSKQSDAIICRLCNDEKCLNALILALY